MANNINSTACNDIITNPPKAAEIPAKPRPKLSVVIAAVNERPLLEETLNAITRQSRLDLIEVVLVLTNPALGLPALWEAWGESRGLTLKAVTPPTIHAEPGESEGTIPYWRSVGVGHARGEILALIEDHVQVGPTWAETLMLVHEQHPEVAAVGGPVENGQNGWVNWAAFYCEYARYMGPIPSGPTHDLPGNNIAYKRNALLPRLEFLADGKWESWINDQLQADGETLWQAPDALVHHVKPFRFTEFLTQRFHFARSFAGMRREDQPWTKRLVYAAGSAVLPAVLLKRNADTPRQKPGHTRNFLRSLPLLFLFHSVTAVGESLGYLTGGGNSLKYVA